MADKDGIETAFRGLWEDTCQKIEDYRGTYGFEANDPIFRQEVEAWFGNDSWDAWLEWFHEGDED